MKGKKYLAAALALLLTVSLLAGCGGEEDSGSTAATVDTTEAAVTIDVDLRNTVGQGSDLIEYDPDREIYFTCHNRYNNIYLWSSWTPFLMFHIISKNPIDLETVSVEIPVETKYSIIMAHEESNLQNTTLTAEEAGLPDNQMLYFPYYLYREYCKSSGYDLTDEKIASACYKAYQNLTPEDIPEFYAYRICVMFDALNCVEESFTEINITVGDKTYCEQVGKVNLYPKIPSDIIEDNAGEGGIGGYGGINGYASLWYYELYPKGNLYQQLLYAFTADRDMTLKSCELMTDQMELLELWINYSPSGGGFSEFAWDGASPLDVYEGDSVGIIAVVKDENLGKLDYYCSFNGYLIYDCELGTYSKFSECTLFREVNYHELYAIVFNGIDTSDYWEQRYENNAEESWRDYYLE